MYVCTIACLMPAKFQNWHVHTVLHTIFACHELTLGLSHHTCSVATGIVAVGNENAVVLQLIGFFLLML